MSNIQSPNKILITRLSSLGDILLVTPMLRSLKNQFPDVKIDFLLREQYKDVLSYNPNINRLYVLSRSNTEKIITSLKNNQYDLTIDLQNNFRSRRILKNTNTGTTKIVRFKKLDFYKFLLVTVKINRLKDTPQIPERYAQTISNLQLDNKGPEIFIPDNIKPRLEDGKEYIGIAPGSRHFTKMYPKEYFRLSPRQLEQ